MRNHIYIFFAFVLLCSFKTDKPIIIDKAGAQQAFNLLLKVRANPVQYSRQLHFSKELKVSKIILVWNDTLAAVAEAKVYDMANRDYFGHTDPDGYGINYFINRAGYSLDPSWISDKSDNFFESIAAGNTDAVAAIKALIVDKGAVGLGHRKHLLGLDKWNAALSDVGIGFCKCASGSSFQTYTCVIIARHGW